MNQAIRTYQFIRQQQQLNAVDACTDAAQLHRVSVHDLARALIAAGIDAQRLEIL